jgi:hypothetical protein
MTKPTPGPWKARYNGSCWQIDAEYDAVATTQFCHAPAGEANALLIAAAPELYDALQLLHDNIAEYAKINNLGGFNNHDMKFARAALAKARGEP